MKIILSRKGFDSGSGGCPSPILPDGRMISFPIPDKLSSIRYKDIRRDGSSLGNLVEELTDRRIPATFKAHLDPDINQESLLRAEGWKPIFGQTGPAQGHLRNNDVKRDDIFLFFGLFRSVINYGGKLMWDTKSRPRHVIWGWMQIGEMVPVDSCDRMEYQWACYHPHFQRPKDDRNVVYVSRDYLSLPGMARSEGPGAVVFNRYSEQLQLTDPSSDKPSLWSLPKWFYPRDGKSPLTYHGNLDRWELSEYNANLKVVGRGQEFILDCDEYPEAITWVRELLGHK